MSVVLGFRGHGRWRSAKIFKSSNLRENVIGRILYEIDLIGLFWKKNCFFSKMYLLSYMEKEGEIIQTNPWLNNYSFWKGLLLICRHSTFCMNKSLLVHFMLLLLLLLFTYYDSEFLKDLWYKITRRHYKFHWSINIFFFIN